MPPVLKVFGFALSSLIGGTVGVGFYYRPIPEVCADDEDKHKYSNTPIKGQGKAFFFYFKETLRKCIAAGWVVLLNEQGLHNFGRSRGLKNLS
mmetsp:Transcript_14629/g.24564  ORF Transcript_14629/g.24564 Transcript_14629/m.24564 type:complete len:93 (-) Transcript_14629:560-838(-)